MSSTPRQAVAQSLAELIHRWGGWITNPLPLHPAQNLRFDCRSTDAIGLSSKLEKMKFIVRFVGTAQQMRPAAIVEEYRQDGVIKRRVHGGPIDCTSFEVDLPSDVMAREPSRQRHGGELATVDREESRRHLLKGADPFEGM